MRTFILILFFIALTCTAQEKKTAEEDVYGMILNGNASLLITSKGLYSAGEREIYRLYFEKVYTDTLNRDAAGLFFQIERNGYFNPVLIIPVDTRDFQYLSGKRHK